jgi:hypothetical protein
MHMQKNTSSQKQRMSVDDFLEEYSITRCGFYAEKKSGRLRTIKDGRRTFVTRQDAEDWLQKQREN